MIWSNGIYSTTEAAFRSSSNVIDSHTRVDKRATKRYGRSVYDKSNHIDLVVLDDEASSELADGNDGEGIEDEVVAKGDSSGNKVEVGLDGSGNEDEVGTDEDGSGYVIGNEGESSDSDWEL